MLVWLLLPEAIVASVAVALPSNRLSAGSTYVSSVQWSIRRLDLRFGLRDVYINVIITFHRSTR